jgi:hypothetical protein
MAKIDITLERFDETSRICGYTSRQCFEAAKSPRSLRDTTTVVTTAIRNIEKLSDFLANVNSGKTVHRAFQIRPSPDSRSVVSQNLFLTGLTRR